MVLKLNVLQRLLLNGFVNDYHKAGLSLSDLSKAMKVAEKLAFTEEEQKVLNVRLESADESGKPYTNAKGESTSLYRWNKENAETKEVVDFPREIEFSQDQADLLKSVFNKKNDGKEFNFENGPVMIEVAKELGISIE